MKNQKQRVVLRVVVRVNTAVLLMSLLKDLEVEQLYCFVVLPPGEEAIARAASLTLLSPLHHHIVGHLGSQRILF